MLDKNTVIKVTNRDNSSIGYSVPDLGIRRVYQPGETKEVTYEEIQKLSYIPGGQYLIDNLFLIDNPAAVSEIIGDVEPEYYYSEKEIKELLLNGSIDQLHDCLTFAPAGVVEIVKSLAVSLKINDIAKRALIAEKTGFNVNAAIMINEASEKEEEVVVNQRKATPIKAAAADSEKPQRRVIIAQKKSE